MNITSIAVGCCVALLSCSCGGSPPEAKKEAPVTVDPNLAGTITGKVAFTLEKPERREISMDATPACARQHSGPVYSEEVIVNSNGTLKNAFVYIKAGLPSGQYPPPSTPVKLDQKGCIYSPHVIGIMVGQQLEISNSDDTNHNIHPLPKLNREWNESQPPKGEVKVKTFANAELPPFLFKCNVHPWMRAWVGVSSHPFFAVTSDDGTYTIKGVPAGDYTLEVWHERYTTKEMKVTVQAGKEQTADFAY